MSEVKPVSSRDELARQLSAARASYATARLAMQNLADQIPLPGHPDFESTRSHVRRKYAAWLGVPVIVYDQALKAWHDHPGLTWSERITAAHERLDLTTGLAALHRRLGLRV